MSGQEKRAGDTLKPFLGTASASKVDSPLHLLSLQDSEKEDGFTTDDSQNIDSDQTTRDEAGTTKEQNSNPSSPASASPRDPGQTTTFYPSASCTGISTASTNAVIVPNSVQVPGSEASLLAPSEQGNNIFVQSSS